MKASNVRDQLTKNNLSSIIKAKSDQAQLKIKLDEMKKNDAKNSNLVTFSTDLNGKSIITTPINGDKLRNLDVQIKYDMLLEP